MHVESLVFIDDNNLLLTASYDPMSEDETRENEDFEVVDEIPFWANGQGFTNKKRNRLYRFDIENQVLNPVTDDFTDVYDFRLNQGRTMALVISNAFIDKMYFKTDLQVYDLKEDCLTKISPFKVFNYSYADFFKDGIVFIGNDMQSHGLNQNSHFT